MSVARRIQITYLSFALFAFALFFLDRVSKLWASGLAVAARPEGFLAVYPAYNEAGFLGLLPGVPGVLLVAASVLLLFWLYYNLRDEITPFLLLTFTFFFAGILGNAFDRIVHGHVIDWIYIHPGFILNLADLFIALALLFLFIFLSSARRKALKS